MGSKDPGLSTTYAGIRNRLHAVAQNIEKQGVFEIECGLTPELSNAILEHASGTPLSDFISLTTSREGELAKLGKALHSAISGLNVLIDALEI